MRRAHRIGLAALVLCALLPAGRALDRSASRRGLPEGSPASAEAAQAGRAGARGAGAAQPAGASRDAVAGLRLRLLRLASADRSRAPRDGAPDERSPEPSGSRGITLDVPRPDPAAPLARVTGFDRGAPRAVWLWRRSGGDAAVVAHARSGADGEIVFPPLAVPAAGLELVAAPAGEDLRHPDASEARHLAPRPPPPPQAGATEDGAEGITLSVVPEAAGGYVVLADAAGRERARFAVATAPDAARRSFEIAVTGFAPGEQVLVGHELEDGRHSAWRSVAIPAATEEGEVEHAH